MTTTVTDEQIRELAATAKPYSLILLSWGPERHMDGADAIELEHQRRMVSLRADGVIAILCPVGSDTLAGVAIMTLPAEEAHGTDERRSLRPGRHDDLRSPPVPRLPGRRPACAARLLTPGLG
jgi:hypothetical protein